jgi:hypothetical protein
MFASDAICNSQVVRYSRVKVANWDKFSLGMVAGSTLLKTPMLWQKM